MSSRFVNLNCLLVLAITSAKFAMNFSSVLQHKRGSHLPFKSFRFQTEGSSAVVAFQLNCVVGGERRLSVSGCLKSSVLRNRNKNIIQTMRATDPPSLHKHLKQKSDRKAIIF